MSNKPKMCNAPMDKLPEQVGQRPGPTRNEFTARLKKKLLIVINDLENIESEDLIELDNIIEPWFLNAYPKPISDAANISKERS